MICSGFSWKSGRSGSRIWQTSGWDKKTQAEKILSQRIHSVNVCQRQIEKEGGREDVSLAELPEFDNKTEFREQRIS